MKTASAFLQLDKTNLVEVFLDGECLQLPDGGNLASALLAAGVITFRQSVVSGAPRAPFCMMGACFECMIDIDGAVRQACMLEVKEGLRLSRPQRLEPPE